MLLGTSVLVIRCSASRVPRKWVIYSSMFGARVPWLAMRRPQECDL